VLSPAHATNSRPSGAVTPDGQSFQLVRDVLAAPVTRIPLWRDTPENIVGILHAKDLLRAIQAAGGDLSKVDVAAVALPHWIQDDGRLLARYSRTVKKADITTNLSLSAAVDQSFHLIALFLTALLASKGA